jgi:hypothetical protein
VGFLRGKCIVGREGKVEEMMFRKNLMSDALKCRIAVGGTNDNDDPNRVVTALQPGNRLNSIGAERD